MWWEGEGPGEGLGIPGMDPSFRFLTPFPRLCLGARTGWAGWWPGPEKSRGAWRGTGLLNRSPSKTKLCGLAAPLGLSKDLPATLSPPPLTPTETKRVSSEKPTKGRAGRVAGRPGWAGRPGRPGQEGASGEVFGQCSWDPLCGQQETGRLLLRSFLYLSHPHTPHISPLSGAPT